MSAGKEKFPLWYTRETRLLVEKLYQEDDCRSQSEFIEKAIRFYAGYLSTQNSSEYLPKVLADLLGSTLGSFGDRIGKLLYKLAVEQNTMSHLIAADSDLDIETYERLRARSNDEVRKTNGEVSFKDALVYQKSL